MRRNFIIFFILSIITSSAFDYKEMLRQDPAMISGEYYHYVYKPLAETAAPKGYKPFYISHYGRHGSRYHSGSLYFQQAMRPLQKGDSLGILTPAGKRLLADLQELLDIHQGHFGMLSEAGINEHRDIARRMYERFPSVFSNKSGRDSILCRSSLYPRCLASMANFMSSLQQYASQDIKARMYCGDDIQKIIAPEVDIKQFYKYEQPLEDSIRRAECPPDNFLRRMFSDVSQAMTFIDNPYTMMKGLANCASIVYNLDHAPNITKHLTQEEIEGLWVARNARMYYLLCNSKECPECAHMFADALAEDIVRQADDALRHGSEKAADFRFGHDTMVLPLASLIGLDGLDGRHSATHVQDKWNCTISVCMASNLQLIFFKNRKNDIIVKCMYNEQERLIPALKSYYGCFYKWADLRQHLVKIYNKSDN